jgi:hypothetical protein
MALFELKQDFDNQQKPEWSMPNFKDCVAADIDQIFFNGNEHADMHNIDGKDMLVILEESTLRKHSSHWEAGAKQNFDTGLYNAHLILFVRVADYGAKPKVGKELVMDQKRTYKIVTCEDEGGVYRMILERVRQ